jgi:hypothetical protein
MKSFTGLLFCVLILVSCKKENETSTVPGTDVIDTVAQTVIL